MLIHDDLSFYVYQKLNKNLLLCFLKVTFIAEKCDRILSVKSQVKNDQVVTFIISLDMSLIVAWISGILTRACMDFMTSVLFSRAPAILRVAIKVKDELNNCSQILW